MKILICIALFFSAFVVKAQFPVKQTMGSKSTEVMSKGAFSSDSGYIHKTNFPDTLIANLGFLKNIPNIFIVVNDTLWKRNNSSSQWLKVGGTTYTGTLPINVSGSVISLGGLTGYGSANQILGMNNAATAWEYKTVSTSGTAVANDVGVTLSGANALVINLPTASSTVRGVLNTTDWTTFNGKQTALSGTGYVKFSGTTASYLTPTQATADLNLFTASLQGLVPGSGGTARMVLHGDGVWRDTTAASASGITTLNTLTAATQTFAVGTAGTDFAISSVTSTHTFNLPTASASNRGALSSANWTTFNDKQPAGNYITDLTSEVTATGPGSVAATIDKTITPIWTGAHTFRKNAIASTSTDGLILENTTAATTPVNSQRSPRIRLTGQGWKSGGTPASQTTDWWIENRPVEGSTNPFTHLYFVSRINAGAESSNFGMGSFGDFYIGSSAGTSGQVFTSGGTNVTASWTTPSSGITALTGDGTATGPGSVALTLATVNGNVGTWNNVTVNGKGLVTAGSNVAYLTANQTITLSGDVSGSGTVAITTAIGVNKVLNTMIRQSAGLSVIGRSANTTGDIADITGVDGNVLRVSGTTLGFGTIVTAGIANSAVTLAKMADMATSSLIYRRTAGTGVPEVNTLAQLKTDLLLTGTNSGDQTITLTGDVTGSGTGSFAATIANDAVTYAKMQNVSATSRIMGRITAAAGDMEELTGTQATTLLDNFTSTLKGLVPLSGGGTTNFLSAAGTWIVPAGTDYNSSNGITEASNNFKLGGTFIENTTITGDFDLTLGSSGSKLNKLISYSDNLTDLWSGTANMWLRASDTVASLNSTPSTYLRATANTDIWAVVNSKLQLTISPTDITVGSATGVTGYLKFKGVTSGTVGLKVADAAGAWILTLPTDDGTSGQFLQTDGNGVAIWATASAGGSVFSALTAAAATNDINNTNYSQEWRWSTLANSWGLRLSSASTSAVSNQQQLLSVALSGANANSTQTTYSAIFDNQHTGTASTNVAGYFTASGGTNNYGLIVAGGNVGIGTTTPTEVLDVTGNIRLSTALLPDANDGAALGTTALQFSDLFLAEGAVINFDNGDATITQAGNVVTLAGASLNARIDTRVTTVASSSTPTPDGDASDMFTVTALAATATFGAPTGTPTDGQQLVIRVLDNGTSRTLAWNAIYRASTDLPLPTATVISKTMYIGFIYNSASSKWDLVSVLGNL